MCDVTQTVPSNKCALNRVMNVCELSVCRLV